MKVDAYPNFDRITLGTQGPIGVQTVFNAPNERIIELEGVHLDRERILDRAQRSGLIERVELQMEDEGRRSVQMRVLTRRPVEHRIWQESGALIGTCEGLKARNSRWLCRANLLERHVLPLISRPRRRPSRMATAQQRFRGKRITIDLLDAEIVMFCVSSRTSAGKTLWWPRA